MFRYGKTLIALAMVIAIPVTVSAQTADKPPAPSSPAQSTSQSPPSAELLKPEQLEALVAPIALYPDELLVNVLAASIVGGGGAFVGGFGGVQLVNEKGVRIALQGPRTGMEFAGNLSQIKISLKK